MDFMIIAIDGYSGTGKSSTAKSIAAYFGYKYLDSGAMYRSVALACLKEKINISEEHAVTNIAETIDISFGLHGEVFVDEINVTDDIRSMEVNNSVSQVSSYKAVRNAMVQQQRRLSQNQGVVMDGRDIGTVVFPNADLKIFMTASAEIRAERRQKELLDKGINETLIEIKKNLIARDEMDSSRKESPLVKAPGAIELDTSNIKFEDQVSRIIELVEQRKREK